MKKKIIIPVLAATLIGGAVVGNSVISTASASNSAPATNQAEDQKDDDNITDLQAKAKLTVDEAQAIAINEVPGTVNESELEDEDGVVVYGFEIQTASGDVNDVKVNAINGDIVKVENDADDDENETEESEESEENDDNIAELQAKAKLTSDEAQAIALKEVPGTVNESELEDEDGVVVYGFEIQSTNGVQDVKIDAATGKVVKVEADNEAEGQEGNE
ncbi:PepSY domain-containing protein [Paenisporosarcina indica]|uniref:PepSY domain-containing protein n=1 Tax=Paenisporosarcina indica TaxID=650093 RepID=UPI00094FF37D|nr:PepSY domain-containing protein [Paenisporosarcina indica]